MAKNSMKIATFLGQISERDMGGQSNFLGSGGDSTSPLPLGEALLSGVGKGIA